MLQFGRGSCFGALSFGFRFARTRCAGMPVGDMFAKGVFAARHVRAHFASVPVNRNIFIIYTY